LVILGWTVAHPFGWPEAIVAVPAAAVVIGKGVFQSPGRADFRVSLLGAADLE
jgi:hypothetical protein